MNKLVSVFLIFTFVACVFSDQCFPAQIPQCTQALDAASEICNKTLNGTHFSFHTYAKCVSTSQNVLAIDGCSYCYCQETMTACPANVTKPKANPVTPQCYLPQIAGCEQAIHQAISECNNTVAANQQPNQRFNYAAFAKCVAGRPVVQEVNGCSKCFCDENMITCPPIAPKKDQCYIAEIDACPQAIQAGVEICNATFAKSGKEFVYAEFVRCVSNTTSVMNVNGCGSCYCKENMVSCGTPQPAPVKPNNTNQCYIPQIPGCADAVKTAISYCNSSAIISLHFGSSNQKFSYQKFAKCVANFTAVQNIANCSSCWCQENMLDNCPIRQPTCSISSDPKCFAAISPAVEKCNKTVTANSADYYNDFYNCIQADKTVASVSGCSTCYCKESLSQFVKCDVSQY